MDNKPDTISPASERSAAAALLCGGLESAACPGCNGVGSRFQYSIYRGTIYRGIVQEACGRCDGTGRVQTIDSRSHNSVIGREPAALSQDLPDKPDKPEQNQPK